MIDIKRIVEDKEGVKQAFLKRIDEKDINLDEILDLYNQQKEKQTQFEQVRANQNSFNEKMAKVQKGSSEFKKLLEDLKAISSEVKKLDEEAKQLGEELKKKLEVLPNIPDDDLVAGGKENNEVVRTHLERPTFDFDVKDHLEIGEELGLFDMERASKIAGANFAMYTGLGAQLEWAMVNYFISQHTKDNYEMVLPPHLLTRESGYTAGQLPKFEDDVFWTKDDRILLPTAETALANLYRDEVLDEADLPKKMFSYTPCYRKEAGSYRKNERGLMRMHQFNKVEMFQYTTPENSNEAFEEILTKAEKLVADLGLHYNTVKLAAGDCSEGMARTYDIEVYLPYLDRYIEVSSVSNSRDYQARRGNIKYKPTDGAKAQYLHMLNGSGLATSRLMVAILETYQNADASITVPEVLRPFMGVDVLK